MPHPVLTMPSNVGWSQLQPARYLAMASYMRCHCLTNLNWDHIGSCIVWPWPCCIYKIMCIYIDIYHNITYTYTRICIIFHCNCMHIHIYLYIHTFRHSRIFYILLTYIYIYICNLLCNILIIYWLSMPRSSHEASAAPLKVAVHARAPRKSAVCQ